MGNLHFDGGRRLAFDKLRDSLGKELTAHLYFLPWPAPQNLVQS
jgi:hypothetical protein